MNRWRGEVALELGCFASCCLWIGGMDVQKFVSDSVSSISVGGILLKLEGTAKGFVLEVEDDFRFVGHLVSHGLKRLEGRAVVESSIASSVAESEPVTVPGGDELLSATAAQPPEAVKNRAKVVKRAAAGTKVGK